MRITINHALDLLDTEDSGADKAEIIRVLHRVQDDYHEIIENALSLLVQHRTDECQAYLGIERAKLDECKERIALMVTDEGRWHDEFHRLTIEYLYTRARLVDEIRLFPHFALELLERLTLDESLAATIAWLENAMTGRKGLYQKLIGHPEV